MVGCSEIKKVFLIETPDSRDCSIRCPDHFIEELFFKMRSSAASQPKFEKITVFMQNLLKGQFAVLQLRTKTSLGF